MGGIINGVDEVSCTEKVCKVVPSVIEHQYVTNGISDSLLLQMWLICQRLRKG